MNNIKLITLTALIGLFLCACDPAKRAQKREDKLVDQAGASRAVLSRLYPTIMDLWPCVNDSGVTIVPGGYDTLTFKISPLDPNVWTLNQVNPVETPNFGHYVDSVTKKLVDSLQGVCASAMQKAFDSGFSRAISKPIKIPVKRPDTVKISVLDKRGLQTLTDSLNARDKQLSKLQGVNETLKALSKTDRKNLIISIVVGALLLVIVIYLLFKKRL